MLERASVLLLFCPDTTVTTVLLKVILSRKHVINVVAREVRKETNGAD